MVTTTADAADASATTTPSPPLTPQEAEREKSQVQVTSPPLPTLSTAPILLLQQCFLSLVDRIHDVLNYLLSHVALLGALSSTLLLLTLLHFIPGPHTEALMWAEGEAGWVGWWVALGIASSIGLGTGLHTFVLFLGPFIAEVTVAAYACGGTDFAVRGAEAFVCAQATGVPVSFWMILRKVQWEAFYWGLGTAIGELPPYFMARAAALSGDIDADLLAIEELSRRPSAELTLKERLYLAVHSGMKRLGFLGIFLCASIPNPLFDLAGITCGHFLIPFSTFFGATLLGKAVVKSCIQSTSVILIFSPETMDALLSLIARPFPYLHALMKEGVERQLALFQGHGSAVPMDAAAGSASWVGVAWNGIIGVMMLYFAASIVESVGQTRWREEQRVLADKVSKSM